jgi:hypothetical protein
LLEEQVVHFEKQGIFPKGLLKKGGNATSAAGDSMNL